MRQPVPTTETSASGPTLVRTGARPKLRGFTFDDYARVSAFQAEYGFGGSENRDQWMRLWVGNPAFHAQGDRWPLGWILELDGQIVGHIANIPNIYFLNGRRLLCASGRAWVIHPAYRGYSQLMLDEYLNQESADFVLTNTANAHSYAVHRELGAKTVPVGDWEKRPIWITNHSGLLKDWFSRKGFRAPGMFSYVLAPLLALKDARARRALPGSSRTLGEIATAWSFDERFDLFWQELQSHYPNRLLAARDRETLSWHFGFAAFEKRLMILTCSSGTRLIAYAVFVVEQTTSKSDPIRRVLLADYQSLVPGDEPFGAILRAALELSRRRGFHLLVTIGFSASGTDSSKFAPYQRSLENSPYLYKAKDPELSRTLEEATVWCPTLYDGDATL